MVGWLSTPRARPTVALLVPVLITMAMLLLAAFAFVAVLAVNNRRVAPEERAAMDRVRWRPALGAPNAAAPDVYHIVLDSFGRPDRIKELWGVEVGDIVTGLEARGFTVSSKAHANYDQTYLSLSSMLNMDYVNPVAEVMADRRSMVPLHELISDSAVADTFKDLGYRRVVFGGNYSATTNLAGVDECRCAPTAFGEFEAVVMALTPLRQRGLGGLEYGPHRRRIEATFAALEAFEPGARPVWVLSHVMAPHVPFVFDRQGRPVAPDWAFSFAFPGRREEFVRGYEEQANYLARRVLQTIDSLLARSARDRRSAVMIVHGDHNARLLTDATTAKAEDGKEVLPVLLAIRWVDSPGSGEIRSLVNVYRELFGRYFGGDPDRLADVGYVSSQNQPYRLIEATVGD